MVPPASLFPGRQSSVLPVVPAAITILPPYGAETSSLIRSAIVAMNGAASMAADGFVYSAMKSAACGAAFFGAIIVQTDPGRHAAPAASAEEYFAGVERRPFM